ncbi:MAG: precorrin-6Y C5,15-methyltransferase (decarboxylating) subunit CbiT [Nitrososphaeraceae archaeon]|nr:precorrin-6Y C5,15-methyltransferase (decarboxylating) subunit CbiT [Nitrososphaeraceae archaeon]
MWEYATPGIPDDLFITEKDVPITKEEIRAIIISKLRLRRNFSVIDVGCGSGSVTVEICMQTQNNQVYAIDFDNKAIDLTKRNLERFGVYANIISGTAQEVLSSLPIVDAIFVGGTWGKTEAIINLAIQKLRSGGRLVISTILIETMYHAINAIDTKTVKDIDISQIIISKSKKVTTGTMMLARNPILIVSATKI